MATGPALMDNILTWRVFVVFLAILAQTPLPQTSCFANASLDSRNQVSINALHVELAQFQVQSVNLQYILLALKIQALDDSTVLRIFLANTACPAVMELMLVNPATVLRHPPMCILHSVLTELLTQMWPQH